jgi:tRNA G10  N-methylase Trm11
MQYKNILASDINHERMQTLKAKLKNFKNIFIFQEDALNLKSVADASVDSVVTDPLWGYYENKDADFNVFYTQMLQELSRVLKSKGVAVILTAKKDEFLTALNEVPTLSLQVKYDILVSGKKAGVYKLSKK